MLLSLTSYSLINSFYSHIYLLWMVEMLTSFFILFLILISLASIRLFHRALGLFCISLSHFLSTRHNNIITRRCLRKNSEWWRQMVEQKQTIISNFEPWERLQHSSMDRLSPEPFQNGADCQLLQLMQSHQHRSTRD